ncbi:hypothetical protein [Roseibium sediminicola]|uniref:Uncharacterized protein n=1 Tax=Roseibium sediminicola TaxID=2933272 RepID=A0ABT0GT56_9HYPH|nr:hypothetical protein [Roseibium sp. CAU 1639]MCK7612618.1 hypothetical protein [Roseibium sp. CAU 1639]
MALAIAAGAAQVAVLLGLAGLALAFLSLAHIMSYALRRTRMVARAATGRIVPVGDHAVLPIPARASVAGLSRRRMMTLICHYAGLAAMASIGLPTRARADCGDCAATYGSGYLDCITYYCNDIGQTCCPPGYPYLNHCDCTCYDGTGFDCGSYSNCNYCG